MVKEQLINELRRLGMTYEFGERRDFIGFPVKPLVIVYPRNEQDVIALVKLANEYKVPVIPWGAGTSLTGALSCDGCVLIDMRMMDRVLEVNTVDWYVRVQPGIILDRLNEELARYGFFFPVDPASHYMCTVGGMIATGAGGMRALRYGTMRDWVLALRVVLPTGEVAQFGEPLRKDRAGYDLVHLFIGSEGTLGIITEAWLRIIPIPKKPFTTLLIGIENEDELSKLVTEIRENGLLPELMEYMDHHSIIAVNKVFNGNLPEAPGGLLIIRIEGEYVDDLMNVVRKVGVESVKVMVSEEEAKGVLMLRSRAGEAIKAFYGDFFSEDLSLPISRVSDAIREVRRIEREMGKPIPILAHIGDGNIHPHILIEPGKEEEAGRVYEELCRVAIRLGGSITGEHGVGLQKAPLLYEQFKSRNNLKALLIMKRIKELMDPNGIMNPNKYVELSLKYAD
ncbi:FAD-binding oxidoreductase [Vulcanisaeta thermophila]|uniref:FAD-binding oxidoreductase n=1 Tax=Vulcanisaeta thermophila TaxID=867917 RepID=UPI000853A548|nr:FAD-binding oxidoreductase [Vulcanisaeta thermophila]